ncbi:hypothetical protein EC973_001164 [Apophysomyces ossiformis]|uniref:Uncharacterized protein n=1 Tax=Apophysomyces ossiformis TaxID=679940 RepID=A0A8H7ENE4_9FUNG|nr:hypothetical protein EC973_001164 [Apophysomyces ossiformis]
MSLTIAFAETIRHPDSHDDTVPVVLTDQIEFPPLQSLNPDRAEWHFIRRQETVEEEEPLTVSTATDKDNWECISYQQPKPLYAQVAEQSANSLQSSMSHRHRPIKNQHGNDPRSCHRPHQRHHRQRIQLHEYARDDQDLGEEMWAVYKSATVRRRRYNARSFHRHADVINRVYSICTDRAMAEFDILRENPEAILDHKSSRRFNSITFRFFKTMCSTMPEPNVPREKFAFSLAGEQELDRIPRHKLPKGLRCELL